MNSTNGQLIAQALKSEESSDWTGGKVVLYDDPSVSYGGKLVGGIRVRAVPKSSLAPAQSRPAASAASGGSAKSQLKAKLRSHPQFGKDLKPDDVNAYMMKHYGGKLDELPEEIAQEALSNFDAIVEDCLSDIPF